MRGGLTRGGPLQPGCPSGVDAPPERPPRVSRRSLCATANPQPSTNPPDPSPVSCESRTVGLTCSVLTGPCASLDRFGARFSGAFYRGDEDRAFPPARETFRSRIPHLGRPNHLEQRTAPPARPRGPAAPYSRAAHHRLPHSAMMSTTRARARRRTDEGLTFGFGRVELIVTLVAVVSLFALAYSMGSRNAKFHASFNPSPSRTVGPASGHAQAQAAPPPPHQLPLLQKIINEDRRRPPPKPEPRFWSGEDPRPVAHLHGKDGSPLSFPFLRTRSEIPAWLDSLGLKTGAEVGVFRGEFSRTMLQGWTSCERYIMIDPWAPMANYFDTTSSNDASAADDNAAAAKAAVAAFLSPQRGAGRQLAGTGAVRAPAAADAERAVDVQIRPVRSTVAAQELRDGELDFVYIDARHDYCAVKQDLEAFWSKVRCGGVFAGHDFLTDYEMSLLQRNNEGLQDWSRCEDGSRHRWAVKGAVMEFLSGVGHPVLQTLDEWPTWYTVKQC
ncbi:unnamed protein product [Pedinophyceae sp. YPF-701]|nr:unnamed protein product [Pedinophyceae sp. YPF-701]